LRGLFRDVLEPLRVLRDRVLEPLRPFLLDLDEDVLLLRDPGGEDVRVAMVINLGHSHTSHRDHRVACRGFAGLLEIRTSPGTGAGLSWMEETGRVAPYTGHR
jgi:hypothetical protein